MNELRDRTSAATMAANHVDALLLMRNRAQLLCRIQWWGGERLFALVLARQGRALCVCPAFEEGRARELLTNSPEGKNADVRTWQEARNPYQLLARGFKDLNISAGTLGMEESLRFVFSNAVARATPAIENCERNGGDRRLPHDQE